MNTKSGYIALVGKPNAGKSTLMNALMGTKLSIVTPKPQTTRKRVLGIYTDEDTQIVFHDTPGILKPKYEMQKTMMEYVDDSMRDADVIAVLLDLDKCKEPANYFHPDFLTNLKNLNKPKLLILNKLDTKKDRKEVLPIIIPFNEMGIFDEIIPMSALKSNNIDTFIEVAKKYLPEGVFYYDPEMLSTQPQRFFVSEMIREHIFKSFGDEVPYSTEVNILEFKERESGKWFISADVIVERDSQKKIIIGKGGQKIKSIGEKARADIEEHLGLPIYLELFVKVRKDWRDKKGMLKSFGY